MNLDGKACKGRKDCLVINVESSGGGPSKSWSSGSSQGQDIFSLEFALDFVSSWSHGVVLWTWYCGKVTVRMF